MTAARAQRRAGTELVLGGAGFIGCNVAARLAGDGHDVLVFDDLSRAGTEHNLDWLLHRFPRRIQPMRADIRDAEAVDRAVASARRVFHFAGQVAVTTSLANPRADHAINTLGTLNVLEAARRQDDPPPLLFTSTNKVYGGLPDVALRRTPHGYEPEDPTVRARGIDEHRPLAFCSPYGCSKGAADQYVLDYAHTFGLPAAVVRMSCIYGPRQFGNEDQGWVAHFIRQTLAGEPITIFGDGLQVRDVLYVDDLVDALLAIVGQLPDLAGEAFNVGGGPANVLSLDGLLERLLALHGHLPEVLYEQWRPGDQRYWVSNTARLQERTGWRPRVDVNQGVQRLYTALREQLSAAPTDARSREGWIAL